MKSTTSPQSERSQFPTSADTTSLQSQLLKQHRLPQQVFADSSASDYLFFEYARAFSPGAWHLFARLAKASGDSHIWFETLDPEAEYYIKLVGSRADRWFPATSASTEYVQHMHEWPPTSIADAPVHRAYVVVWMGDKGRWACWGEWECGLCVVRIGKHDHLRDELLRCSSDDLPILTIDEALDDVVVNELKPAYLEAFSTQFRQHYTS